VNHLTNPERAPRVFRRRGAIANDGTGGCAMQLVALIVFFVVMFAFARATGVIAAII
jgi:hypothetical protein